MPAGRHSSGKKILARVTEPDSLNENQARYLRVTCQHIDRLLCEIESILNKSGSATVFPSYIDDISPAQREMISEYTSRIRAQLVEILDAQEVDPGKPEIPVSRAIYGRMYCINMAADEIRPRRIKGTGSISPVAAAELERFAEKLKELAGHVDRNLREDNGQNY